MGYEADGDLDALLNALAETAALPRERARAFPPRLYVSQAFHALELARVFAAEWHCVGRADELAETGSYLTDEIAGEPVFVVRDENGDLRAFANICRHRGARLLEGGGKLTRIVCPYHAWAYDLSGQLRSAPYMGEDFEAAEVCLPELRLEVWEGFVYVSLNEAAEPLAQRLTDLSRRLGNYGLADYRTLFRVEEVWDTHWKCLVENFTDPYHLFHVHAKTVDPALPTRLCRTVPGGAGYSLFEQERVPGVTFEHGQEMARVNPQLTEEEQRTYPIACVYPAHVISVSPERLFWMALQPDGTTRVRVRWGVDARPGAIPAGAEGEERIAEMRVAFEAINAEDKGVIAGVRRNAASRFAAAGPLSPLESTIWEFQRYLARRLCDAGEEP